MKIKNVFILAIVFATFLSGCNKDSKLSRMYKIKVNTLKADRFKKLMKTNILSSLFFRQNYSAFTQTYNYMPIDYKDSLKRKDHVSGHIILSIYDKDKNIEELILGINKKYDNYATLGGLKDKGETLEQTLNREFSEETLDCIVNGDITKIFTPNNVQMFFGKSPKGLHFHAFLKLKSQKENNFSFEAFNECFKKKIQSSELIEDEKENKELGNIPINQLKILMKNWDENTKNLIIYKNREIRYICLRQFDYLIRSNFIDDKRYLK